MNVDQDMSGQSPSCADVHDLTAGFAFGALDPDDQRAVEQHCDHCPPCAALLRQARQTATMLSFAVRPVSPPPTSRAALFARIAQSSQAAAMPPSAFSQPAPGVTAGAAASLPASSPANTRSAGFRFPFPTFHRRGAGDRPRAGWSALTVSFATVPLVLVLALVGVSGFALRSHSRIEAMQQDLTTARGKADHLQSTLDTIDSLVADADSRVYYLPPQNTGIQQAYGKVYVKPGSSDAMLLVWGLQPTTNGGGYQVVLESKSGKMIPCANFQVDRRGYGSVMLRFDQPFTTYESVRVMSMPANSSTKGNWTTNELLSAPISPIVGQPGDTDPPPTQ